MTCLTKYNAVVERVYSSKLDVTDVVSMGNLAKRVLRAACLTEASDSCPARRAVELLASQCELLCCCSELLHSCHSRPSGSVISPSPPNVLHNPTRGGWAERSDGQPAGGVGASVSAIHAQRCISDKVWMLITSTRVCTAPQRFTWGRIRPLM